MPGAIAVYERGLRGPRASAMLTPRLDEWRAEANLQSGFEAQNTGRFTLLIEGPEERRVANGGTRVLEAAYARIGGRLNAFPDDPIPVILYTAQRFQDVTRSPQWAGGLYASGRIRLAVGGELERPRVAQSRRRARAGPRVRTAHRTERSAGLAARGSCGAVRAGGRALDRSAPPGRRPIAVALPLEGGFSGLNAAERPWLTRRARRQRAC